MPAHPATVTRSLVLYLGYLALFFGTWVVNGVDYLRIGENAQTTRLWYALPTLFGGAFLVVALSVMGWWRASLFERSRAGPAWLWVLPAVMGAMILSHFLGVPAEKVSAELLLWSVLGAIGVGFGEEMITRGSLIVGLRSRFSERRVWLFSSLLFAALHAPNVLFGLPVAAMAVQLVLTFIMGTGFYLLRRLSGTLLLPMVLHGLWDSALFLGVATGAQASAVQFAIYPLVILCAIAALPRMWRTQPPA